MCYQVTVTECWPPRTLLTKLTRPGYRYQNTIDVQYVTQHCPVWPGPWTTLNSSYLFSYEYTDTQTANTALQYWYTPTLDWATVLSQVPLHHFLILPVSPPTHSQLTSPLYLLYSVRRPELFTLRTQSFQSILTRELYSFNLMIVTLLITSELQLPELSWVLFIF